MNKTQGINKFSKLISENPYKAKAILENFSHKKRFEILVDLVYSSKFKESNELFINNLFPFDRNCLICSFKKMEFKIQLPEKEYNEAIFKYAIDAHRRNYVKPKDVDSFINNRIVLTEKTLFNF